MLRASAVEHAYNTRCRGMIRALAWDFSERFHVDFDDLVGVGHHSIMMAAKYYHNRTTASFATYVYRIAKNNMQDFVRKYPAAVEVTDAIIEMQMDPACSPAELLAFRDDLSGLSEEARTVCQLVFDCGTEVFGKDGWTGPKGARGSILRHLRKQGWSHGSIDRVMHEIKDMVKSW